jgi:hypothetical protein
VAKGAKVVGKKGEILEKKEEVDSDEDDSEAIRKMAFDGECMI